MQKTYNLMKNSLALLCILATGWLLPTASQADAPVPTPIQGKGYHLVKNWDFSRTVTTKAQLADQFYTRYVYNNGTLDTLNDEWERYRDNDNHELDGHILKLIARDPGGLKSSGIESGMIRSKWTGEYGYYECRMKVPRFTVSGQRPERSTDGAAGSSRPIAAVAISRTKVAAPPRIQRALFFAGVRGMSKGSSPMRSVPAPRPSPRGPHQGKEHAVLARFSKQ